MRPPVVLGSHSTASLAARSLVAAVFAAVLVLSAAPLAAQQQAPPSGASQGWWSSVQKNIAEQEYYLTWQERTVLADLDAAWQAPNRAHGFRTYFTAVGVRVVPRTEPEPTWELGLSLIGYGRPEMVQPVASASLVPRDNRIEYDRGAVLEWYVNDRKGLKQGFTLAAPPPGEGDVHLDMELTGTLSPSIGAGGQVIEFRSPGGVGVLRYAELIVRDASSLELPARMEGFNRDGMRGIRIVFDDRDALYPVTVDPLATSPAWTAESNQTGSMFGYSVGTAGDVNGDGYSDVIVGAYLYDAGTTDEGRAFVFHGSVGGLSTTADWTVESDQYQARFGVAVATAGDVNGDGYSDVIVGAYLYDNVEVNEGGAFVYHGSAAGLSTTADWTGESDQASAYFGRAVGTAGDVNGDGYSDVIVGAYTYDGSEFDEGRAYVYHGSAGGLSAVADWTAEGGQELALFGFSLGTAGDVDGDGYSDVIVGAYRYDNGQTDEGGAFVFHGSASGLSATADWMGESNQDTAYFGNAVGTAGDVNGDGYADVIVGTYRYDGDETDEGRAFVYHGSAAGLSTSADWTAESDQVSAYFGYSAATAGDVNGDGYADVVVGAYYFDNGNTNEGAAFLYQGSATGLSVTANWTAEGEQDSASFGFAVGTAGDVDGDGYSEVIVGAYQYDNDETNEGRVYVYRGSAASLSTVAGWTSTGDQAGADFGRSVGTAGDVNGDGYADVVVGAPYYDNGESSEGRAFAFYGSATGLGTVADWSAESDQAGAELGWSVGTAGDVNGDGYSDVVVGAPYFDNGQSNEGRAFVYHGSPSGLSATFSWSAESDQATACFGHSAGTAGDVNGDGFSDVIVGSYLYDNGETDEGRAFVYHGSSSGLSTTPAWSAESDQAGAYFGNSVGAAGDVNGDGFSDVIVGAYLYDNGETDEGRVWVFHGSPVGLGLDCTLERDIADSHFGYSVGTAGDIDGDGYSDAIIGANWASALDGIAYLLYGSAAGLTWMDYETIEAPDAWARFGASVGTAGDVDGDGYSDAIIGANWYSDGLGRAYLFKGSATGLTEFANWTTEGDWSPMQFGISVGTAGDVNGDGYADAVVGGLGRASVYHGNDGPGLSLVPGQRRADDSAPISPLGVSDEPDSFRLRLLGRSPYGRSRVKLEYEVKPLGTLFDSSVSFISAGWADTGTTGVGLSELVSGLTAGAPYHWRVRLLYDPAATPFQQVSRWLTVPWNGWEEADLRTRLEADIALTQSDSEDPILTGSTLTYSLDISSAGPDTAEVLLWDELPDGVIFVSCTPSQGSCGESGGVVECELGAMSSGASATVSIVVTPDTAGIKFNLASAWPRGQDPNTANNSTAEQTTVYDLSVGNRVWEDLDGNGIQDAGEPGMAGVVVGLYDSSGTYVDATGTDSSGYYSFTTVTYGTDYYIRFTPPEGYVLTLQDQGGDDLLDSDADPYTWKTPVFSLVDGNDPVRWDAGMIPDCVVPDEPVYIYSMTLTDDGNDYPVLHFMDANQPSQVTGYNAYRSSDPAMPPAEWPLVASDIVDMDEAEPNIQWVDTSGDVSPTGVWYYQVTAYNHRCPAEGPR